MVNFVGIIGGAIAAIAGYAFIYNQKKEDELLYRIQRTPPLELEDAVADVSVKISGKVVPIKTLKSHYQNVECVYYISKESELVSRRKSSSWETTYYDFGMEPFYIDDGSGKIIVELADDAQRKLMEAMRLKAGERPDPEKMIGKMMEAARTIPQEQLMEASMLGRENLDGEWFETEKILDWKGVKDEMGRIGSISIGGRQIKREEWVIRAGARIFAYGMVRKKTIGLAIGPDKEAKFALSVNGEEQFLKNKRKDDTTQKVLGYGLALCGAGLLIAGIFILT